MAEIEDEKTQCTFMTQYAANNDRDFFSSPCTTKTLSPQHHRAQAIKCVFQAMCVEKAFAWTRHFFTP